MAIIKPIQGYAPMQRQRKASFPFQGGMRSIELKGQGANRSENAWHKDGRLRKMPGITKAYDVPGAQSIVMIGEFVTYEQRTQIVYAFEESVGVYKFRAIEDDGTILTPATVSTSVSGTGTVSIPLGSTKLTGVSTAFTTEAVVGDYINIKAPQVGDDYMIVSIESDTELTLERAFTTTTVAAGTYNINDFSQNNVGDYSFDSDIFDFESVLKMGYLSNYAVGNSLFRWDGTRLSYVSHAPDKIRAIARDAKRLSLVTDREGYFSCDTPYDDFTSGLGVNRSGEYQISINEPRAMLTAGMGVVIIGKSGSEAHKVIPNNASDDVSADTKIDGYNDKELGVDKAKKAIMGKSFIWRVTDKGIMKTNPFNGETINVTDIGKTRDYMDDRWDATNASIAYDETNEQVVCALKEGAQNDILVCIDSTLEEMPISIKPRAYYSYLSSVAGKLYGGSSREGQIDELFTGRIGLEDSNVIFRHITEWDELTNQMYWKIFKRLFIAANLSPLSSMTVKVYFDGETSASYTETFTTKDVVQSASPDAPYGLYLFRGGAVDLAVDNTGTENEVRHTKRFSTMCIEVYESSGETFGLEDMILEYKTKNKFYHGYAHKNVLFT